MTHYPNPNRQKNVKIKTVGDKKVITTPCGGCGKGDKPMKVERPQK